MYESVLKCNFSYTLAFKLFLNNPNPRINRQMSHILGVFECTLDAKQRIKVPTGLISQLPATDEGKLVLTIGVDKCIYLYTESEFRKELDIVMSIPEHTAENRRYKNSFFAGTHPVTIDSAERILIPKSLLAHAGITKDILINGQGDKALIWDQAIYNKDVVGISGDEYQKLYEKVRGVK